MIQATDVLAIDIGDARSMIRSGMTVVGIDVGANEKGFHAVALRNGAFWSFRSPDPAHIAEWCRELEAKIIAIDAPCAWSASGGSRLAERSLTMAGKTIQCFKTPTRSVAEGRNFYDWVRNGEALYRTLSGHYELFDGASRVGNIMFETFPHAVLCALAGKLVSARRKSSTRRQSLRVQGYAPDTLRRIDYVDAGLCALTAERFLLGETVSFGDATEGFIVIPNVCCAIQAGP